MRRRACKARGSARTSGSRSTYLCRSPRQSPDPIHDPTKKEDAMPRLIEKPTRIEAAGNKPKIIDEYGGRVNSKDESVSVAHMKSPGGWVEPGQRPTFRELTIVLRGRLVVEHEGG